MKKPKVFVVDDDKIFSKLLEREVVETINAIPYVIDSGEKCLEYMHLKPDIILLDYNMRGLTGIATLEEIKKVSPQTPVILVSGQEDVEVAIDAIELGARAYVDKNADTFPLLEEHLKQIWAEIQDNKKYFELRIRKDIVWIGGALIAAILLIGLIADGL